ncbi:MAG: hypothetical protein QM786_14890 [Breznakibacter sp.]
MNGEVVGPVEYFTLAGLRLKLGHIDDGVLVNKNAGSRYFFYEDDSCLACYDVFFRVLSVDQFPQGDVLLTGRPWDDIEMPYSWEILQLPQGVGILVHFDGKCDIETALVSIDRKARQVTYYLHPAKLPVCFDLYENPLGVLLSIYLAHFHNGVVIHASGVDDKGKGYLFTGVSGIGKSTMARIWGNGGATVVNDDRLMLMPVTDGYNIANTPMPYYTDVPKEAPLTAIFLLAQSKDNTLVPIKGAKAMAKVMANCMQHLHTRETVGHHLEIVQSIIEKVPVFELAFKPDADVVRLVRGYLA